MNITCGNNGTDLDSRHELNDEKLARFQMIAVEMVTNFMCVCVYVCMCVCVYVCRCVCV